MARMSPNEFAGALFFGVVLALAYVRYARRRRAAYGIGLTVAACVYVSFSIVHGHPHDLLIEVAGVALFGTCAFLGVRKWTHLLAVGWIAHVAWDLLLHPHGSYAPWWYPTACIGFDLIVAGAIIGGILLRETP